MEITQPLVLQAATWLPEERETTAEVVASGRMTEEEAREIGLTAVPAADIPGPDLAVRAAERVLAAAEYDPARLDLVAHAWIYHQGHDFWSPPHYVADRIGAREALPLGVQHMSNGGAAALGVAVDRLLADPRAESALVTTGDRFAAPGFDRWTADYGAIYGDAGTAALLRRRAEGGSGGTFLLRSLCSATAAEFEAMYRGRNPFTPAARWDGGTIDIRRPKKAYLEMNGGMAAFMKTATESVRSILLQSLAEAGLEPGDPRIRWVALPRLSTHILAGTSALITELTKAEIVQEREGSGHLGAGDVLANLADLSSSYDLEAGEFAVVIGGGGGFTWSCAVVQAG
ncbi:ketoacyl-ACP synthase III family protein [Streptomyces sp. NPDC051211]|uniref:ketoacyl-ACP synthase III family protein n=1 Tax=Streptomyces sp. NPDC051211 TaxID=3154643 RepID=UPI00344B76D1